MTRFSSVQHHTIVSFFRAFEMMRFSTAKAALVLCVVLMAHVALAWIPTTSRTTSIAAATNSQRSSPLYLSASSDDASVQKGTVKWFDTMKGFGFISPDDGSSDVFVHQTAIQAEGFRSLADGEAVEYRVEQDSNGRRKAVQVTGPGGKNVQGAPFRPTRDYESY